MDGGFARVRCFFTWPIFMSGWFGDKYTRIEWLEFWHDFVCLFVYAFFSIELISCMHKSLFLYSQEEQAAQQQLEELQARPNVKITAWACRLASPGDNLWAQESTARLHQESPELATGFFWRWKKHMQRFWGGVMLVSFSGMLSQWWAFCNFEVM